MSRSHTARQHRLNEDWSARNLPFADAAERIARPLEDWLDEQFGSLDRALADFKAAASGGQS